MTRSATTAAELLRRASANHGDQDLISIPRWAAIAAADACDEADTIETQLDDLREEMEKADIEAWEAAKADRKPLYDEIAATLGDLRALVDNIFECDTDEDREPLLDDVLGEADILEETLRNLRRLD